MLKSDTLSIKASNIFLTVISGGNEDNKEREREGEREREREKEREKEKESEYKKRIFD